MQTECVCVYVCVCVWEFRHFPLLRCENIIQCSEKPRGESGGAVRKCQARSGTVSAGSRKYVVIHYLNHIP